MFKISLITPTYNSELYIEDTIKSVISQGYENLEYIIIDGKSNDGTLEIIDKYKEYISIVVSEPDKGMYHALQKGFELANGDVYGWINSDDILLPGALKLINKAFSEISGCKWLTGIPSNLSQEGIVFSGKMSHFFRRYEEFEYLNSKPYAIQQESTFFSSELYHKAGGISLNYKLAGDYELWARFYNNKECPVLINSPVGAFRTRDKQLSKNKTLYLSEVGEIRKKYNTLFMGIKYRFYSLFRFIVKLMPWIIAKKILGPRCVYFNTKKGLIVKSSKWI